MVNLLFMGVGKIIEKMEKASDEAAKKKKKDAELWTKEYIYISTEEDNRQEIIENMNENTPIYLLREIHNNHEKKSKAIAVYEGKSHQRIGYLPYNKSFDRQHSYNDVISTYLDSGNKMYAGVVKIIKNDRYHFGPLKYKTIYQAVIVLSLNEEELQEKVLLQREIWEEDKRNEEKSRKTIANEKVQLLNVEKVEEDSFQYDIFDSRSDHDDYDEDGIPYEDYERDNLIIEQEFTEGVERTKEEFVDEALNSRSDHDDYDEDGISYEDYEYNNN